MAVSVTSPDGQDWVVGRRLAPRLGNESAWARFHKRFRKVVSRTVDGVDVVDPGCLEVFGEGIVVALGVILFLLILFFVAIPLLVAVVDILIVIALALAGIAARIVFRRPWVIEARNDDDQVYRWRVVGWKASGERVGEIARILRAGATLPSGTV
jgi:hypothetical protein